MSELEQYHGNCHCGFFKFSIKIPDLKNITVRICNCSICIRNAYLWIYPIADERLSIESGSGEEALTVYEFGKKDMRHFFCPKCGSSVMGRRKSKPSGGGLGINARMLKDIDLESLTKRPFLGSDLGPAYVPPTFPDPTPLGEIGEGLKLYKGNCHCGAVTYTVKTKPLEDTKVMKCNCSSCSRNADLWIYPPRSSAILSGEENLTGYAFLSADSLHSFCKICGVSICVQVLVEGEDMMPLNARAIHGVDIDGLEFKEYDGRSQPPLYSI